MNIDKIGVVYARESNLLKKTDYDRILDLLTLKNVWVELVALNLGYEETATSEMLKKIPKVYSQNIKELYLEIVGYLENKKFLGLKKCFLYEFDFHNIKLFYKQKIFEIDNLQNYVINLGWIGIENLTDFIKNGTFIPEIFKEKQFDFSFIFDFLKNNNGNSMSPLEFDIMLDKILFDFRIKTAQKDLKNDFLENFWKKQIDFYNIKIFFNNYEALKKDNLFIPNGFISVENFINILDFNEEDLTTFFDFYGYKNIIREALLIKNENKNSVDFEIAQENLLLDLCKEACFKNGEIELIIGYFYRKYCEIKNLNRILFDRAFKKRNEDEHQISKTYFL